MLRTEFIPTAILVNIAIGQNLIEEASQFNTEIEKQVRGMTAREAFSVLEDDEALLQSAQFLIENDFSSDDTRLHDALRLCHQLKGSKAVVEGVDGFRVSIDSVSPPVATLPFIKNYLQPVDTKDKLLLIAQFLNQHSGIRCVCATVKFDEQKYEICASLEFVSLHKKSVDFYVMDENGVRCEMIEESMCDLVNKPN